MQLAIWGLAACYQRVEQAPRYMSQHQADGIYESGMMALQAFAALNVMHMTPVHPGVIPRPRWVCKPKMHKFHHLLRDVRWNSADLKVEPKRSRLAV